MSGKKSVGQAIESGVKRGWLSLLSGAVGAAVSFIGGPWLGVPAAALTRMALGEATNDSQPKVIRRPEKVINPYPELPPARKQSPKPASRAEAAKSFKELNQITGRLLLEYRPSS
jgi:hypothetical protein